MGSVHHREQSSPFLSLMEQVGCALIVLGTLSQGVPINNDPITPTGHLQHKTQRQRQATTPTAKRGGVVTAPKYVFLMIVLLQSQFSYEG